MDAVNRKLCPQLLNRHAFSMVNDKHLSFRAKGIWLYMLMKPAGWDFSAERIAKETKESPRAIYTAWKELKYLGYLTSHKLASGREVYKLYEMRDAPEAPFLGDYDFETSGECSEWRDDCPTTRDSRNPDAKCTVQSLADHLIFAEALNDADAWREAEDWAKACREGELPLTWRNASVWVKRIAWKYPQTQTAETQGISI